MKVKEIDRTANIAWSPASHHPVYLAAGTAAQQLDATFSTTACLEIYALNLTEPGLDMALKGSVVSDYRFHKVVWGCEGMKTSEMSSGVLVGGADNGNILMYDPAKLLAGEDALLHHKTKHTGPVHSLDFNKFQDCLLASGAGDSEIFIWDLNNTAAPMTPGAKSQPVEDVTCVAWNCQVQHILASTFPARCVVWDLRKNEPIIKVSDSTSRIRCKMVAWHPEVATQLCLASEDDHSPLIQLWDLRFATSPLRTLEHHQRGVLSIAWCAHDPDLLLSCGKDNRILCWNPNSNVENGEIVCELPTSNQWSFDVAWCPRNPAVIANASCDGHVSVFCLMGGQQQVQCNSKIAESFPGSEKFIQPPLSSNSQRHVSMSLQKPPKWLRKPVGASFGFGGKLVSFLNEPKSPQQSGLPIIRNVYMSQVVTEPELLNKAAKLESALNTGNLAEFCQNKVDLCTNDYEKITWNFLQATFSPSPRTRMLSLLGYDYQKISSEVTAQLKNEGVENILNVEDELLNKMFEMGTSENKSTKNGFSSAVVKSKDSDEEPLIIRTDEAEIDGLLSQTLLTGNIEAAVEICLQDDRWADALVLAQAGGPPLLHKTQKLYFKSVKTSSSKLISAVVTSDWMSVVKSCDIECWKEGLAAILTYAKPEEFAALCERLGSRLENEKNGVLIRNAALCYISAGNLECLAQCWFKMQDNLDTSASLQSFVEQIMILRRAVEQFSGSTPPLETGTLSTLLGQFAALLAAQGSLISATTYLVDANEQTLAALRDRIYQSLGHQTPNFPFERIDVQKEQSVDITFQQYQEPKLTQEQKASFQNQNQQPQFSSYVGVSQSVSSSTYRYPVTSNIQYQQQPQVGSSSNMMQITTPPITTNVTPADQVNLFTGKSSTAHHLSQRYPRHLYDPSVYSENSYSQQQYYQPQILPDSQLQMNQPNFSLPSANFYSTEQNVMPTYSIGSNATPSYQSSPYHSYSTPVPASDPTSPTSVSLPSLPSSFVEVKTGWNDPPLLKQGAAKPPLAYDTPAPITIPLIGGQAPDATQPMLLQHGGSPGGFFGSSLAPQNQVLAPNTNNTPPPMQPRNASEPSREKGPIPPEHQILQDIFEDLRQQCQQVATNPQTKRKLEDVAKKLENLYDQLRESALSNAVTLGFHQIVQAILQSDYQTALSVHGQLVSTTNFSEISGFMPSVKVLLQTASQLGVFLQ